MGEKALLDKMLETARKYCQCLEARIRDEEEIQRLKAEIRRLKVND